MNFFKWLEQDKARLRKVIAVIITIVWVIATIATYVLSMFAVSTLAIYSVVTAQLTAVVGFYMGTKVNEPK